MAQILPVPAPQPPSSRYAAHPLVTFWFIVSTLVVTWDLTFVLFRPRSFTGGDLSWIWRPYELYGTIDLVYGRDAWTRKDPFNATQSILNVVENGFNLIYLYLARKGDAIAPLVGFFGATCTLWKTVLYWLLDQQCSWCQTGHNDRLTWWLLFAVPNGCWLVIPAIMVYVLGREMAGPLRAAYGTHAKVKVS